MNFKHISKISRAAMLAIALSATSCVHNLDVAPIDPNLNTPNNVFVSEAAFEQSLAKIYAGFVTSGQKGPDGEGDLGGLDEGHSQYWRGFWMMQELPTDEAINGWGDAGLPSMSQMQWTASNPFIRSFYSRAIYQVSLVNEFIRNVETYGKADWKALPRHVAEARFLRALAYWHALDLFGNRIPFVTEKDAVGPSFPKPAGSSAKGPELFNYIAAELEAIIAGADLEGRTNYVGRADKGAARMLLAKLYLNHKAYLGTEDKAYYTKAQSALNELLKGGYSLETAKASGDAYNPYQRLFLADNHTCRNEMVFSFSVDGLNTRSWGAMTYLVCASIDNDMKPAENFGVNGGWGGNRSTPQLVAKFEAGDQRSLFWRDGREPAIDNQGDFKQGFSVTKYRNKKRDNSYASNAGADSYPDIDVPVFRVADVYLMLAELDYRQKGSFGSEAINYVNMVRTRAGIGPVTSLTEEILLDERSRELYWEGHRRTDLRRFGKLTSGYSWAFKGGVAQGKDVPAHYELMPIPAADMSANPNLVQNPGY